MGSSEVQRVDSCRVGLFEIPAAAHVLHECFDLQWPSCRYAGGYVYESCILEFWGRAWLDKNKHPVIWGRTLNWDPGVKRMYRGRVDILALLMCTREDYLGNSHLGSTLGPEPDSLKGEDNFETGCEL